MHDLLYMMISAAPVLLGWVAPALGALGSIGGALIGGKGAKQAAQTAADANLSASRDMFDKAIGYEQQQQSALRSATQGLQNPFFAAGGQLPPPSFLGASMDPAIFGGQRFSDGVAPPPGAPGAAPGAMPPWLMDLMHMISQLQGGANQPPGAQPGIPPPQMTQPIARRVLPLPGGWGATPPPPGLVQPTAPPGKGQLGLLASGGPPQPLQPSQLGSMMGNAT